jgi:hypothetical protein
MFDVRGAIQLDTARIALSGERDIKTKKKKQFISSAFGNKDLIGQQLSLG